MEYKGLNGEKRNVDWRNRWDLMSRTVDFLDAEVGLFSAYLDEKKRQPSATEVFDRLGDQLAVTPDEPKSLWPKPKPKPGGQAPPSIEEGSEAASWWDEGEYESYDEGGEDCQFAADQGNIDVIYGTPLGDDGKAASVSLVFDHSSIQALFEAWDHYLNHGCDESHRVLDDLVEAMLASLIEGMGRSEA